MKKGTLTLAIGVALAIGAATSANGAALLSLSLNAPNLTTCGTILQVVGNGGTVACGNTNSTPQNNVVGGGIALSDKAVLSTTATNVALKFYHLGAESGWQNTLKVGNAQSHAELNQNQPIGNFNLPTAAPFAFNTYTQAAAGSVFMEFSGPFGSIFNSSNANAGNTSIAFAFLKSSNCGGANPNTKLSDCLSLDGAGNWVATDYVLFGLDDSGAGPNDNHDDWMGLLVAEKTADTVVPLPAAAWLLLSGMAGLFGIGRRRRAS